MIRTLFTYVPYAVFILTMLVFVVPSGRARGWGVRAQAIWAMILLLASSKFLCYKAFGGDEFNPNLPMALIWGWNLLYSGAMILPALSVALFFLPRRLKPFLLPALAWGLAAWGIWNGVRIPDIREVEIVCPNLPASLDGYRIVQIADLHASSAAPRWRTEAIVAKANAAKADLIVCTGDIVDGNPMARRRAVEPLKNLEARDGVYFTTGNHEFYNDWNGWLCLYERWGIRFLRNECVFPRDGLALAGVNDDSVWNYSHRASDQPNVPKAFASATNGEFRVLLQHRPSHFRDNAGAFGVGLQLSGHTHGGIAPGLDRFVARQNGGFVRGLYESGDGRLYISTGCGQWAGFPIRLVIAPEISLVTLRAAKAR